MADSEGTPETLISLIGRQFAAVLGATGALGTLFYAGGVLTQNAYFWALRAQWLSREIGLGDIFHGSFGLLPSAVVVPIAIVLTLRIKPAAPGIRWIGRCASFFLLAAIASVSCDRFFDARVSWHAHSRLDLLAVLFFSGAVACVSSISFTFSASERSFGLPSAAAALVALMILFVGIPFCLGRSRALEDIAAPRERLPLATIDGSKKFPVVATGAERVYCLLSEPGTAIPTVIVFKWERVSAISPPAEQTSDQSP